MKLSTVLILALLRIQELTDNLIKKQATLDTVSAEKTSLLYKIENLQVGQCNGGQTVFNYMLCCI